MADRARAEIDARHLAHVRMIAERTAEPRIVVEPIFWEEAEIGEDREQADRGVALAHQETVASGHFGSPRRSVITS